MVTFRTRGGAVLVASALGRKCYIGPAVIAAYAGDALPAIFGRSSLETSSKLNHMDAAVLRLLEARS